MKEVYRFEATGTTWKIDIDTSKSSSESEKIVQLLKERVEVFEGTYSRFREDSLMSVISKNPGVYKMPDDAKQLFETYIHLNKLTNGLFTPLIAKTLEEAGYDANYSLETKNTLTVVPELSQIVGYKYPNLEIKSPAKLDFGAGGKGHIIDIVGELLEKNEISNFCIDAGGDLLYKNMMGKDLRVGLEDPTNFEQAIGVVNLKSGSLCGSSGNRRKWGQYNHIVNPKTLESSNEILAVWTMAKTALLADSLATCLFFVDPEKLKNDFEFEHVILYKDYSINKSANFTAELFSA